MQSHAPLLCEPIYQRHDGHGRIGCPLGLKKRHDFRRTLHGAQRPWSAIAKARKTASGKPFAQLIERLATVPVRRARGCHGLSLDKVCAQHLVLDLELVAGVEERGMLPKRRGTHPRAGRVKRPLVFERSALVGAASGHRGGLPRAASHGSLRCVNRYIPHMPGPRLRRTHSPRYLPKIAMPLSIWQYSRFLLRDALARLIGASLAVPDTRGRDRLTCGSNHLTLENPTSPISTSGDVPVDVEERERALMRGDRREPSESSGDARLRFYHNDQGQELSDAEATRPGVAARASVARGCARPEERPITPPGHGPGRTQKEQRA